MKNLAICLLLLLGAVGCGGDYVVYETVDTMVCIPKNDFQVLEYDAASGQACVYDLYLYKGGYDSYANIPTYYRDSWKKPQMPFYFVQLPNHEKKEEAQDDSDWACLNTSPGFMRPKCLYSFFFQDCFS